MEIKERKKYIYTMCQKCGSDKKPNTSSICNSCQREYRKMKNLSNRPSLKEDIINFIKKVESRNGFADMFEIYVEMITLFNDTQPGDNFDSHKPSIQLEKMYIYLKEFVNWKEIKYNIYKKSETYYGESI